jgi:hypothetical protein
MDLAFVVAAVLSLGSAPTKHATFSIEPGRPEATQLASNTPDSTSSGGAIAESDTLDLQFD